jgi:hypothetical protein
MLKKWEVSASLSITPKIVGAAKNVRKENKKITDKNFI